MRRLTMLAGMLGAIAALAVGAVGAAADGGSGHQGGGGRNHDHGHHFGRCGKPSAFDEYWLTTGLQGDVFEVKGGQIAQQKSSRADIKQLGEKLVADHTESFSDGSKLARRLGIEVKNEPTHSQTWELEQVAGLSGSAFDAAYSHLEVLDHEQDIEDAQEEVEKGSNCEVRKDAKEEIPMLKEHLALAKAAEKAGT